MLKSNGTEIPLTVQIVGILDFLEKCESLRVERHVAGCRRSRHKIAVEHRGRRTRLKLRGLINMVVLRFSAHTTRWTANGYLAWIENQEHEEWSAGIIDFRF
jgi:hypothetical protein